MTFLIIDIEATCWSRGDTRNRESEIIEIGGVIVNGNYSVIGMTSSGLFIKPVKRPVLSEYCKSLLSIRQLDIDLARSFEEIMWTFREQVEADSGESLRKLVFCSWGYYDQKKLAEEFERHQMTYPFGEHRSLKYEFAKRHRIRPCGMKKALRLLNLSLEGTHHSALDDARNITRIFIKEWGGKEVGNQLL